MQKRYSEEFKEAIIKKMMPPHPVSVSKLSREFLTKKLIEIL
jgi:hypothetical protein